MNELNNYEERTTGDVASHRIGMIASVVYVVVVVVALFFTQCNVGSPEEDIRDYANELMVSFGEVERSSEVLAKTEIEKITPPTPVPPQVEEVEQLTDDQSDVAYNTPPKPEETPKVIEREKPVQSDTIPPQETPKVNKRALFPGSASTQSESRGDDVVEQGVVGVVQGTTEEFSPLGEGLSANYSLSGRSLVGRMPIPAYGDNAEGKVVIGITVDNLGRVTSASLRTNGSTTNNSVLIEAARKAALKARFTPSEEFVQSGTITYIFKLN